MSALDPADEMATARRLVAKGLAASRGKPLPTRIRRLVGLLARKGYPAPIAYRVVREATRAGRHRRRGGRDRSR